MVNTLTVLATSSWSQVVIGILIPEIQRLKHDKHLKEPMIFGTAMLTAAKIRLPEAPVILTQFQVDFPQSWTHSERSSLHAWQKRRQYRL
jgi:hypothetical protein